MWRHTGTSILHPNRVSYVSLFSVEYVRKMSEIGEVRWLVVADPGTLAPLSTLWHHRFLAWLEPIIITVTHVRPNASRHLAMRHSNRGMSCRLVIRRRLRELGKESHAIWNRDDSRHTRGKVMAIRTPSGQRGVINGWFTHEYTLSEPVKAPLVKSYLFPSCSECMARYLGKSPLLPLSF